MNRKRYTHEQIIGKLPESEVVLTVSMWVPLVKPFLSSG
jgi:hypothetical protein